MDFQDKFYRLYLPSVFFHLPYSENKIKDLRFLGKNKDAAKDFTRMVGKVRSLYYAYKIVVRNTLPNKDFHKTFRGDNTIKVCVFIRTCRSLIKC